MRKDRRQNNHGRPIRIDTGVAPFYIGGMVENLIVGCDPGFKGALALLRGNRVLDLIDMPVIRKAVKGKMRFGEDGRISRRIGTRTELDRPALRDVLGLWKDVHGVRSIIIEKVGSHRGDGAHSMFRFGQNTEAPESIALGLGYADIRLIAPQVWKKALGCTSVKLTSVREARARLTGIEPYLGASLKGTADRAEAALIGYCGVLGLGRER